MTPKLSENDTFPLLCCSIPSEFLVEYSHTKGRECYDEYAPKDTSKVVALRKLDARAKLPATVFTYAFGIAAALVTGVGMCLSMEVIGSGTTASMALGIVIGLVGLVGMGVNYALYKKLLAKGKQKYAYEILQLAKEISEK